MLSELKAAAATEKKRETSRKINCENNEIKHKHFKACGSGKWKTPSTRLQLMPECTMRSSNSNNPKEPTRCKKLQNEFRRLKEKSFPNWPCRRLQFSRKQFSQIEFCAIKLLRFVGISLEKSLLLHGSRSLVIFICCSEESNREKETWTSFSYWLWSQFGEGCCVIWSFYVIEITVLMRWST